MEIPNFKNQRITYDLIQLAKIYIAQKAITS
jgi:hypothetical protein